MEKDPIIKKLDYLIYQTKTNRLLIELLIEAANDLLKAKGLPTLEERAYQKTKTNKNSLGNS